MIFMHKRGTIPYRYLFGALIGILILTAFLYAGKTFGNQKAYYKAAVARDVAITIDLAYGLPGDMEFNYPNDVSGYGIEIKNNLVKVYDIKLGTLDPVLASYNFAGINKESLDFSIHGKKFVKISKIKDRVQITGVDS